MDASNRALKLCECFETIHCVKRSSVNSVSNLLCTYGTFARLQCVYNFEGNFYQLQPVILSGVRPLEIHAYVRTKQHIITSYAIQLRNTQRTNLCNIVSSRFFFFFTVKQINNCY